MEMKKSFVFTLTTELKDVLALFSREAGKNKTDSPYPDAILANGPVLSAANAFVSLKYQMGTDELGLMPETFDSPVLIPIKGIRAITESNANTEITISVNGQTLSISKKGKKGVIGITALDASTFPEFGKFEFNSIDKIPVGDFVDAVNSVKISIAESSTKAIYTGMFFQSDADKLSFSSLNGYQASMVKLPYQVNEKFKVSIPRTCLETVLSAVSKKERNDTLSIVRGKDNRHAAFFIGARMVIRTRLIDGEPVDVGSFCGEQPYYCLIDKAEILSVLKSISTIKEDSQRAIVLTFNNNELTITYKASVVRLTDVIPIDEGSELKEFKIGANVDFLNSACKAIHSKKIRFDLNSPVKPMILSDTDEGKENKQVVVPIRISSET